MKKRTMTQLKELGCGDRFVGKGKVDVWQVMKKDGNHIEVNQILNGNPVHKYHIKKSGNLNVMFLRHTIPVPGEECFIEDLIEGDVFYKLNDVVTEYEIITKGNQFSKVKRVADKAGENIEMAGIVAQVIFVRRNLEVA